MDSGSRPLAGWQAVALVAGTSAAVLVIEILAGRVMAPYVGVNLETYTAIIGTILAGIAVGARVGGTLADRHDPRRLITVLLIVGGLLAIVSVPTVRLVGGTAGAGTAGLPSVLLAAVGFLPAATVLSAIPPAVVKLQLRDLDRTGDVVGHLSAWGTGGALAGTFLAGFVLVAFAAVTTLIVSVGVALVVAGAAFGLAGGRQDRSVLLVAVPLTALSLAAYPVVDTPCDVQSSYYCIAIETDPDRPTGRTLVLDDLRHSYVDLDDPTHLEFWYVRQIVGAIDTLAPAGPLSVVSIGGGAMTVPTYLDTTRPGGDQIVLEIDPTLVDVARDRLGVDVDRLDVRIGDGRLGMRSLDDDSADVVVGDAFGSRAVPWHLTTTEFVDDVARVLRPGGLYVVNVIDGGDEDFLRAAAATAEGVLPHVAILRSDALARGSIGNAVIVASDRPVDRRAWDAARRARGDDGEPVTDLERYLDGAFVLRDDFAPVDQLIVGTR